MKNYIGVDILEVSRIGKILDKWEDKFLDRFFTPYEKNYIREKGYKHESLAGIFSSKEAVSKVLGTGFRGMKIRDIEVCHDKLGKPVVNLYGRAKEIASTKNIEDIELTISHEKDYVVSFASGLSSISEHSVANKKKLKRKADSHKGDYGRVGIIAGSQGMLGANYLASMAALRSGAGLVYSHLPESLSLPAMIKFNEVIVKSLKEEKGKFSMESVEDLDLDFYDSLAIGPGLGQSEALVDFITYIIRNYKGPLVIDADGLNNIVKQQEILLERPGPTILTPHPGEFSRLIGETTREINLNREDYAKSYAKKNKVILVLKGNNTIVTDGNKVYINNTGNPGMATAGSGDVLTGIVASFIAREKDIFKATKDAVYYHGLAGDMAGKELGEIGMISSDILEYLAKALK